MLDVENWAEIRRLHRSEGQPIKVIARVMGISKNTVKAALAADGPPVYRRRFLAAATRLLVRHDPEIVEVGFFEAHRLPSPLFGPDMPVHRDYSEKRAVPIIG